MHASTPEWQPRLQPDDARPAIRIPLPQSPAPPTSAHHAPHHYCAYIISSIICKIPDVSPLTHAGDAYKEIYSWQGVCALELWARVLGAHADKPELRPLAYPLVQVVHNTFQIRVAYP